jgi:NitT/TauT family transport system substrate-binding protein
MQKKLALVRRSGLLALYISMAFVAVSFTAQAQTVVREGVQIGALGALRVALPQVQAKYGLKYDIRDFRDSTSALLALEQGEIDVANTTSQHLVRAIDEGIDVVWVAGWGGGYNVLVASKKFEVPANDPAALKAAILKRKSAGSPVKIGVPTGSMQHAKLLQYLNSIGINPNRDTQIVNIPFPNHPRALQAGEVDMAMTLSAFGALAIKKGDAKLVQHIFSGVAGKQEIGFLVMRKLIKEKPDLVQKIVSSHAEAMKMFLGNPDKQFELSSKYSRLPPAVVSMEEHEFLHYDYRTSIADLKDMAKEMKNLGWSKKDESPKIKDHVDLSFLSKATGIPVKDLEHW